MLTVFVSHASAIFSMDPLCALHVNLGAAGQRMLQAAGPFAGIVVVSGHYQASFGGVSVSRGEAASHWETLHDHPASGLFDFKYSAETSRSLGDKVRLALVGAGLDARDDKSERQSLDHGAWLALHSLWPNSAPCPVVQVSLHGGEVAHNFLLGRSLAALRSQGIILVTSGGLTHNQDEFRRSLFKTGASFAELGDWSEQGRRRRRDAASRSQPLAASVAFDAFVTRAVEEGRVEELLRAHATIPDFVRLLHPEPSHWLPLVVALGAAGASSVGVRGSRVHHGFQHGLSETAFLWNLGLPLDG